MRRNDATLALLTTVLALAGCLGSPDPFEETRQSTTMETEADHQFAWSGGVDQGAAFQFTIRSESATVCHVAFEYLPEPGPPGWNAAVVEHRADGTGWAVFGSAWTDVRARALGLVDSSDIVEPYRYDGPNEIAWETTVPAQGLRLTLAAAGLSEGRNGEDLPNLAIGLSCEAPSAIEDLLVGREVVLFDHQTGPTGAGAAARVFPADASAAVGDVFTAEFAAPTVQVFVAESWEHAGRVTITHPGGERTHDLAPHFNDDPDFHAWTAGAGTYRVESHEVGVLGGAYWGALIGFAPAETFGDVANATAGHVHGCEAACTS